MDLKTQEKVDAAAAAMSARQERAKERLSLRLIELNELEEKYSAELGEENRGRTWAIVTTREGFLVIKRVEPTAVRQYEHAMAALKPGESPETQQVLNFAISGLVYPDATTFRHMVIGDESVPGAEGLAALAVLEIRRLHCHFEGEIAGKT